MTESTRTPSSLQPTGPDERLHHVRSSLFMLLAVWLLYLLLLVAACWLSGWLPYVGALLAEVLRGNTMMLFVVCQVAVIVVGIGYVVVPLSARWLTTVLHAK